MGQMKLATGQLLTAPEQPPGILPPPEDQRPSPFLMKENDFFTEDSISPLRALQLLDEM